MGRTRCCFWWWWYSVLFGRLYIHKAPFSLVMVEGACVTQWGCEPCCAGPPRTDGWQAEYFMQNAELDDSQAGIKTVGRNQQPHICRWYHSNAESEEKLKGLLMRVKEESEKAGLKFNIQKTKILASGPITSWQIEEGKSRSSHRFSFLGLPNHCRWWLQPWN